MLRVIFYLLSIVTANVVTARFMPLELGIFLIPMGSFFIGTTFIFRDLVQNKFGRKKTYAFIFLALVLSAVLSYLLGDTLIIVAASALSFLVAELIIATASIQNLLRLDKIIINADETVTTATPSIKDISELIRKISEQTIEFSENFVQKINIHFQRASS